MSRRAKIVLATRSAGKIRELTALLRTEGFEGETLDALGVREAAEEASIESFDTFAENAIAKARWFAAKLPGRVILAEDSGLVVDALDGAPGVRSKRWAGSTASGAQLDADNNAALLRALAATADPARRTARYVCVAALVRASKAWTAEGKVEGRIAISALGSGGFGYDPYFVSDELRTTFGAASPEEKSRVSHRARAVRALFAAVDLSDLSD